MNLCCLLGKMITEPQFDFFYNSKKHVSVVKFKIKTQSEKYSTIINVKAFDEEADYIYRYFSKGDLVSVEGWINQKMEVNVTKIRKEIAFLN